MSGQLVGDEVLVTTLDQIPVGEGRTFHVTGGEIAVFRPHEGGIYVTQAYCPHLGGPLADGLTGGTAANPVTIVCPLHDRVFDLATGCGLTHECTDIKVYPARLDEGGRIWVTLGAIPHREPVHVGADAHRYPTSGTDGAGSP